MTALYIITGIVAFFALVLSVRAHIHIEYEDGKEAIVWAKWAFLKIPILPAKEKPPKQKKKEEPKKEEEPKNEDEAAPKAKKPNPLKNIYDNEQISGLIEIFNKLLSLLDKFGRRLINSFVIDEMFLDIDVTRSDAAETAESYGKICQKVFPLTGAVCANCDVRKYLINIEPDYIANYGTRVAFSMEISLNPRKLINSVLAFAFGAVFNPGIRLIKGLKPKQAAAVQAGEAAANASAENKNVNNTESGVS